MAKDCMLTNEAFINKVNYLRQQNKGKWVMLQEIVDGKVIEYKAFDTWIQILRIDGVNHSSVMNLKAKQFVSHLRNSFGN